MKMNKLFKCVFRKSFLIFILPSFLFSVSYAQQPSVFNADPDVAKKFFDNRNYPSAIKVYMLLLKKDPKNVEYNHKIAQSYLLSNSIKAKAIPHLELIIKQEKYPDAVLLDLGKAYQYANRFDDAIRTYNKYKTKIKDKKEIEMVEHLTEQCHNGAELVKHALNVKFENLGKNVNSEFPDYCPFVSADETNLLFTSRRKSPTALQPEFDGFYSSDIFVLSGNGKDGKWNKAQSIGNLVNTNLDEEAVDISDDGTTLLFYIDHNVGNNEEWGDIWIARRLNNKAQWLKPERLTEAINSGFETSGSYFKDPATENESIYFSSSRGSTSASPNYGETDIYVTRKLPTGLWSEPQNLGTNINTKQKEEFPRLSEDGKILYFASQGHSSMGGFDIFKSLWDDVAQSWSPPKNLGYPINTTDDNYNISFTSGGRIAYLSAMREGG